MKDSEKFLSALTPPNSQGSLLLCAFGGNPNMSQKEKWRVFGPEHLTKIPEKWNGYVSVCTYQKAGSEYIRRAEHVHSAVAFMVDDVGTKIPFSVVEHVKPSAIVETSKGNFQYWYFLHETTETDLFDSLVKTFIQQRIPEGKDSGMAGLTRVGRLPGFTHGKTGFKTRLTHLEEIRFTIRQLADLFGLELIVKQKRPNLLVDVDAGDRIDLFIHAYEFLEAEGMVKQKYYSRSWISVTCPFIEKHTGGSDDGSYIHPPDSENGYFGAFKCHHGSCQEKAWKDVTEWISFECEKRVNDANERECGFHANSNGKNKAGVG